MAALDLTAYRLSKDERQFLDQLKPDEILRVSDFYKPWEYQVPFHESWAKFRLQVGSFGSGKSRPLLMEAVRTAIDVPGSTSIILRKTIPDLKRTVIDKFKKDVPKEAYERGNQELGTYNESDHIVYWPPDPVTKRQSIIQFGACERERDVSKYLSTEYDFVGFEELGEFPYLIWDAMEGRNRSTIPGSRPCMAAATNPMGIGWGWIKRLWIDHLPVRGMDPEKYDPKQYAFFHSTVDQNPILSQDKEYLASLEKSPNRDRVRWGKLDAVSGTYFDNWEEARHVRPASDFIFADYQPVWVGWDYGFGHYAVITFWTKAILKPRFAGDRQKVVNVTIAELILHENTPEEQTAALISKIPRTHDEDGEETGYRWNVESIHFSWERHNKSTKNARGDLISVADQVGDILAAHGLPRPQRSSTDRVAGFTKMYSLLEADEWFILKPEGTSQGCPTCIEIMPNLVRGDGVKVDLEDVVKPPGLSLDDDCADSLRYAVAGALMDEGEKPKEQKIREELAKIEDPMARAVAGFKHYNKETAQQRRGPKEVIVPSWVNRVRPRT